MKTKHIPFTEFTPAQRLALDAMRTALEPEMSELEEAAQYAHHFAQAFFHFHCTRTAAAWATKELHMSLARRGLLDESCMPSRN